jgi:hypothetical protein
MNLLQAFLGAGICQTKMLAIQDTSLLQTKKKKKKKKMNNLVSNIVQLTT